MCECATLHLSVRETKEAGVKVVDVDGSYTHRKKQSLASTSDVADTDTPTSVPLIGWESIDNASSQHVDKIPRVTHGKCSSGHLLVLGASHLL